MKRIAALALLLAPFPAWAGAAADAVRFFYTPVVSESEPEYRDRFTDPARAKLDQNDAQEETDGMGCIDFVMAVNAQDLDEDTVANSLELSEDVTGDDATVTARFHLFPDEKGAKSAVVWTLSKVDGAWKVSDIGSESGDWRLSDFDCGG